MQLLKIFDTVICGQSQLERPQCQSANLEVCRSLFLGKSREASRLLDIQAELRLSKLNLGGWQSFRQGYE